MSEVEGLGSARGVFLLQMAGRPGAGKSTVAARIGRRTGAVVLDLDVLKSTALDVGMEWDLVGKVGYRGGWAMAEALLEQGFSVILDSPCRFEWIVNETTATAARQSATYCFIECVRPISKSSGAGFGRDHGCGARWWTSKSLPLKLRPRTALSKRCSPAMLRSRSPSTRRVPGCSSTPARTPNNPSLGHSLTWPSADPLLAATSSRRMCRGR
ncbi:AAA family ATPase [Kribbella sp. NPDC026596]|uniref:AAA family ATPase n=1 Tax=Kribbella sp. NPDC026596 TaxID=3155122 RepID=UPI0033D73699